MIVDILVVLFWVICSVLAFGICFADVQDSFPEFAWPQRRRDAIFAGALSLWGPFSLLVALFASRFAKHGLRYRPLDRETSWQAFHQQYSRLDVSHWEKMGKKRE